MRNISIIGAGLCGSLLSLYLARQNYSIHVYEKRCDMRISSIERGRSINLAISKRGVYALEQLGLVENIMKKSVPMYARMIHNFGNDPIKQLYGRNGDEHIDSISRSDLNIELLNHMDNATNIRTYFNQQVTSVDIDTGDLTILNTKTCKQYKVKTDIILATEGAPSIIRQKLMEKGIVDFNTQFSSHNYKELIIYKKYTKSLDKNCLHIWPRKNFVLIALPNIDGSFTCTLFLPNKSFNKLKTEQQISEFFELYFSDIQKLIPDLKKQFLSNPIGELATLRGEPWYYKDKVLLLGDAAHAIVPFFGQGMNCAFEDCYIFSDLIKNYKDNWEDLFLAFFKTRKQNTDAIAQMAINNLIEMSKYTTEDKFLLYKSVERKLINRYGERYVSQYILVSFTLEPYKYAQICGTLHAIFLDKICSGITSAEELNWSFVDIEFNNYINDLKKVKNELL